MSRTIYNDVGGKYMKNVLLSCVLLCMVSCSTVAVSLTPDDVKQSVVNATAIANIAEKTPPTGDDLLMYLKLNAESWRALAEFYGLDKETK